MKKDLILKIGLVLYSIFSMLGISGINIASGISVLGLFYLVIYDKFFLYTDNKNRRIIVVLFFILLWSFLVSLFFSPSIKISFSRFIVQILEVSLLFCVINIKDFRFKKLLLTIIIISAFLQSIYGIVQYFTGIDLVHRGSSLIPYQRIKGTLGYCNSLGGLLGMIIPIIFVRFMLEKKFKNKILYIVILLVCGLALIFTKTRGAWVGCFLSLIVLSMIKFRNKIFVIVLTSLLLIFFIKPARVRLIESFQDPTLSGRNILWEKSIISMKSYRVITGYGVDGFKIFAEKEFGHFHPHSIFLTVLNDTGIIGFFLLILFLFNIFLYFRNKLKVESLDLLAIYLGILGSIIDFVVHGLVDNVLRGETAFLFWFLLGIAFSIGRDYLEGNLVLDKKIEINLN